ncbi:hypothetical protein I7I48_00157 [Histoplasma ohiense]|nr:hypothetical protein I7I48_00157 [Histoplasma ohiense (nom. inval.)]
MPKKKKKKKRSGYEPSVGVGETKQEPCSFCKILLFFFIYFCNLLLELVDHVSSSFQSFFLRFEFWLFTPLINEKVCYMQRWLRIVHALYMYTCICIYM